MAVITGPTASGKSSLALALAARLNGTIINADASQLYADLRILTARPSAAEEALAPHALFGVLDGDEVASAARWAAMARAAIADAHGAGRVPILVGGTGLYIRTLIDGIAPVPDIDAGVRAEVRAMTIPDAAAALAAADPAMAARLKPGDQQRIMRALEVVRSTGQSLADWQQQRSGGIGGVMTVCGLVVEIPRAVQHARAETRLAAMIAAGALAEVAALAARRLPDDRPIMRALGVPELSAVLAGTMALDDAVTAIATATRQYQKRQATWGRSQLPDWPRVDPGDVEAAMQYFSPMG